MNFRTAGSPLRFFALFALILVKGSLLASSSGEPKKRDVFTAEERTQGFASGVIIAKPKAGMDATAVGSQESGGGFQTRRVFDRFGGMRVLETPSGMKPEDAIEKLMATGFYEYVEVDRIRKASTVPNDTYFASQWALQNTGSGGSKAGADIDAVSAWNTLTSASSIIVAVIDSGARLSHPDLSGNLWVNSGEIAGNSVDDDGDGYIDDVNGINSIYDKKYAAAGKPSDDNGHGSHVSGIIGAVGNNSVGICGVAWKVQIMPLKFLDSSGEGSASDAIECIDYAIAHGAHIINASYGNSSGESGYSQSEFDAIKRAQAAGIIMVVAAGNDASNNDLSKTYPACYLLDNIVAVGNSTSLDEASSSSNYGSGSCEIFAPGEAILSLGYAADTGSSAYATMTGTSMAAPHVAGALAMIKARFSTDNYRELIHRLLRGAEPVTALAGKAQTGGRLNLANAFATTTNTPFNDGFSEPAVVAGQNISIRSSNKGATSETSEPAHGSVSNAASLWWQWTAPVSGTISLSTSGSGIDTVLAVYTGSSLSGLTAVASNDNTSTADTTSSLTFSAVSGTTYRFAVASKAGTTGLIVLNLETIPDNDKFASPVVLSGLSPKATGNNTNASKETGEPTILSNTSAGSSVWFKWTAPESAQYQVSVYSEAIDPLLAVYTGTSVSGLTLVKSNDNASSLTTNSLVTFTATKGTDYMISVESKVAATTGAFTFSIVDSLWQYTTGSAVTNSPAISTDGIVYFGSTDGYFYALTSAGALKWRYAITNGQDTSSCAVSDDGTVVFSNLSGYVYAVTSSSTLKWRYSTGSTIYNSPAISTDGVVYIKDDAGVVHAITLSSGTKKWTYATAGTSTYAGPVIGTDGTVYVGGSDGVFHAINASSGTKKWSFSADGAIYTSAAIDSSGNLYFATSTGTVYSLSSDGTQRWSKSVSSAITSSPAISKSGVLYLGDYSGKLHAITISTGVIKWSLALGSDVRASSPVVADDGTVYIGCYDGRLYAVNEDGGIVRSYSTGNTIRSAPVLFDSKLYFGSNDFKMYAVTVSKTATAGQWPMRGYNSQRLGHSSATSSTPTITTEVVSQTVLTGTSLTLTVTASGTGLTYQWYKDGVAISGATSSSYTISSVALTDAGTYQVVVTSSSGGTATSSAVVTVNQAKKGRIIALAARGPVGAGDATLIVGFALSGGDGSKTKPIVIRGLGPELARQGMSDCISNPKLVLYSSGSILEENLDWGSTQTLKDAFTQVGLGTLVDGSKDAAIYRKFGTGGYSALISDEAGATGNAMGEIYDADTSAAGDAVRDTEAKLLGISARAYITGGDRVLIGGFVIDGNVPLKILVRGLGPALQSQGITSGYLSNPRIDIYSLSTIIASNDDWAGDASVRAAATKLGGTIPADTSTDAGLVTTLTPGVYTAIISGVSSSSGVALVEIYEVE